MALRRRFLSTLYHRARKRWPFTPYRAAKDFDKRIGRGEIASLYDLSPNRAAFLRSRLRKQRGRTIHELTIQPKK